MADRYAKFQKTATRLIGKWKQGRVTVVRNVGGDPMPPGWPTWEVWPDNSRVEIYELDAVVKGVSAKLIDGTTVIASDRELTCSHKMTLVETIVGDDDPVISNTPVPFDPSILFSNGEQGGWYDPSDLSTVFQDTAGTIPSTFGDPVGLVLDPRLWEGRTLAQELAAQAELVPNGGGPFVNTTGWSLSGSASVGVVDGWLRLTSPDGSLVFAGTTVPTVAGRLYRISSQWRSSGTSKSRVIVGTSNGNNNLFSPSGANSGDIAGHFTAVGSKTWVSLRSLTGWGAGSWVEIPLVTVKEIPGNHLSQTTAAAGPTLMQDGENYYIQPDLTDDALTTTFPATIAGDILIAGRNGSIIEPFSGNTLTIGPTSYTGGTPGILSAIGGIVGVVLIDRSLTQLEQDNLVAYYMARGAGGLI